LKIKIKIDLTSTNEKAIKIKESLTKDSLWYIKKLCNLVTLNREYQAIHSITSLKIKENILNPYDFRIQRGEYFEIP
jgi:hypothetical protein